MYWHNFQWVHCTVKGKTQFVQRVTFETLMVSNKPIMKVGNIAKAATFKIFCQLSYESTQLLFLWQCFLIFSRDKH